MPLITHTRAYCCIFILFYSIAIFNGLPFNTSKQLEEYKRHKILSLNLTNLMTLFELIPSQNLNLENPLFLRTKKLTSV